MSNRKGDWIQTYTGVKFYVLDSRIEDINLIDIAHSLSLQCRYAGHSNQFYSVAEHCVRMSRAEFNGSDPRWRLLHDAAEAYILDIPRPIKHMFPIFHEIEKNILQLISVKWNLDPMDFSSIERADRVLLATEYRDLISHNQKWEMELPEPLPYPIIPWDWKRAEARFLIRAEELGIR